MQKKIRVMRVTYPEIQIPQWQGRKLRGFFAAGGGAGSTLHNHAAGGEGIYRYPQVQYKVYKKSPTILALEEGITEVHPLVMEHQELLLGGRSYPCGKVDIALRLETIGDTDQICRYYFCAPWFGLNQTNYREYEQAPDAAEKQAILERILVGNLLSMAKSLGVQVEGWLKVQAHLQERPAPFKNEFVLGFTGDFSVNFLIPDLFGIGKSVSRGFGSVKRSRRDQSALSLQEPDCPVP